MRWVGIRLEVALGEGVVFIRNPFVLAGSGPPGVPGSVKVRIGSRVRFAPGVVIEAEPGEQSLLEIGDATRVGAGTRFHLNGGSIRIGANCEIRDRCTLSVRRGEIDIGDRCFVGYGCVLDASDLIVLEERAALDDGAALLEAAHVDRA